jgi:hypothetical protein
MKETSHSQHIAGPTDEMKVEESARIGIKAAKAPPMQTSISLSDSGGAKSHNKRTLTEERPLRICVVFDEAASARSAEVLIAQVASDFIRENQAFCFDELNAPRQGVAAARKVADTDILVLAARGDRVLPSHVRLWLGLCLGLRDERDAGALVALITNVDGHEGLHSSILEYLETIAIIGGVAFFPGEQNRPTSLEAWKKLPPARFRGG